MNSFQEFSIQQAVAGTESLIENIKILLYKIDDKIFDKIDFDSNKVYQEPLVYAYFKDASKSNTSLDSILYGYYNVSARQEKIVVESDSYGRIYIPNCGWVFTEKYRHMYEFFLTHDNKPLLFEKAKLIEVNFKEIETIEKTCIEILPFSVPILSEFYHDSKNNLIDVDIENITKEKINELTNAWNLIKKILPSHFSLIKSVTKKCVIFKEPLTKRNSFASLSAQGCAFFNAYQDEYNEVFFVDDIAHQTGHIIFNALTYNIHEFLTISPGTIIQTASDRNGGGRTEDRTIYTWFHALYTYYTTFICLDACLKRDAFSEEKKYEAVGRLCFYANKCYSDLRFLIEKDNETNSNKKILTEKGLVVFNAVKEKCHEIIDSYRAEINMFDLSNQPYNFTYSKFIQANPFK